MADLASQPTSIQSVYTWYREKKLFVNRRYQRKLVWTHEEKQKLIGSILKKYPIPAILLAERDSAHGTFEIIDGLQRLHSIISFIENAFPFEDGRNFDVEFFPTAKTAATEGVFTAKTDTPLLGSKEISTILDYTLALSVMRNASEAEINDVFDRINTYGHRLSDQERRQAGVQNEFSATVRELSCTLRGDSSQAVLPLQDMPSISVDLPKANHGYEVRADEVFWVNQGVLRSTDLRDSLDEQCIADIAACIIGGKLIPRSKDALDEIYTKGSEESERILAALEVYGSKMIFDEINFCVSEILKVCSAGGKSKLRDLVFERRTTNAFPSVFAVILIAFHEIIIGENKKISNYEGIKTIFNNLSRRIETSQKATTVIERRKNIDTVKGLINDYFVIGDKSKNEIYNNHSTIDIQALIRRSEIELSNYELKQGLLKLEKHGKEDAGMIEKITKTICAIANIGPGSTGKILIGVTDKAADTTRIKTIDGIDAQPLGKRWIVGVNREALRLNISVENYFSRIKDKIKKSLLSEDLKNSVLSSIDYNSFFGLGLIVITVPPQKGVSYLGEDIYWRSGDSTEKAVGAKQIAAIASRF